MKVTSSFSLFAILLFAQCIFAQSAAEKSFMFGHSLMDHRPPLIPTPSDETTIAHWIYLLAAEAGYSYSATGQYGFLPQHDNLPPFSQWGYDLVPPAWESDYDPFSAADFTNALITAGNFMQWQGPGEDYYNEPGVSPISATQTIVNWLAQNEPGIKIYIYENWPDMAPYINGQSFPPTSAELANYYNYLDGDFHDWWIEYHDALLLSNPAENVRMIPVGPILSDLLQNTVLNTIPVTELYEDNAPHGRATLYFLAGLVTYMATYEQSAPATFQVPSIVHSVVVDNYSLVVSNIWNSLQAFNLPNGDSRVFSNNSLPVDLVNFEAVKSRNLIALNWETLSEADNEKFEIEHSINGKSFNRIGEVKGKITSDQRQYYSFDHDDYNIGWNYYRLKQIDFNSSFEYSKIVAIEIIKDKDEAIYFYPNPTSNRKIELHLLALETEVVSVEIYDLNGRLCSTRKKEVQVGSNNIALDFTRLERGTYITRVLGQRLAVVEKLILN